MCSGNKKHKSARVPIAAKPAEVNICYRVSKGKKTPCNMTRGGDTWDLCCLTGAQEQRLIMNKAYKKLVDLCNSSFLTEARGSKCCVTAMQNNLVDLHLASPAWESWNHSWIYHDSLPTSTKKNQNPNCKSCCWKEQRSMSRAEGWKPEEHTAQSHEITPSYLLHLFKKQCIQNSSRCQYLWVLMVSHTSWAHMHQNFVTVL